MGMPVGIYNILRQTGKQANRPGTNTLVKKYLMADLPV